MVSRWPHSLVYDAIGRLVHTDTATTYDRYGYDGQRLIVEYDGLQSDAVMRRYVHGPGVDEPLVWYEGSGTSTRRWFHQDERGSVIAVSDSSGNLHGSVNRYDEYGVPQGTLTGRFGYTGQMWLPNVGLYYYRARMFDPQLGQFMQTDPIDGATYNYVNGDPINLTDPTGMTACTGSRIEGACTNADGAGGIAGGYSGYSTWGWRDDFRIPKPSGDSAGGAGGGFGGDVSGSLTKTTRVWLGRFSDDSFKKVNLGTTLSLGNPGGDFGAIGAFTEGEGVQLACLGPVAGACVAAAVAILRGVAARFLATRMGAHVARDLARRGWTERLIRDTIRNPIRTVTTRDVRHLPNGTRMNDPATAYYNRGGGYVVRNDRTGDIVQISNRNDPNWMAPWD